MPQKKDSVIIDTNLWISYLLTGNKKLDYILSNKKISLLFSQELLDELIEVTQRPKFKEYFNLEDISTLLYELKLKSTFINTSSNVAVCRDEKDNFARACRRRKSDSFSDRRQRFACFGKT